MAIAVPEPDRPDRAFERLYRLYVKDVYHYSLALLRNPTDAEDVTQTTFLNAYRAMKSGEVPLKPRNWLIKIAHNAARSRYAQASRRVKEVPLEDHIEALSLPEEERPNVHGVLKALAELPFNQRAALAMRELEGRSYAEIAQMLDVSVSAIEMLIFRARRSLRLRSSALRALTSIPIPGALASLLEGGGGAFAGSGGGLAATGLLVKVAIVLAVGVVATGAGGDPTQPAAAAGSPRSALVGPASIQTTTSPRRVAPRPARVGAAGAGVREGVSMLRGSSEKRGVFDRADLSGTDSAAPQGRSTPDVSRQETRTRPTPPRRVGLVGSVSAAVAAAKEALPAPPAPSVAAPAAAAVPAVSAPKPPALP